MTEVIDRAVRDVTILYTVDMSMSCDRSLPQLFDDLSADGLITQLLAVAAREDLADAGDVTSRLIYAEDVTAVGEVRSREDGVLAGMAAAPLICAAFASAVRIDKKTNDGELIERGDVVAVLSGSTRQMLTLERTMLNLLGRMSGIASLTRRYVDAIAGTNAQITDTRKTTPGLRRLEKYAVACGGGCNHRLGLYDAVLVKDNHLARRSTEQIRELLTSLLERARQEPNLKFVEVEVDTPEQLDAVLSLGSVGPDMVLLDNMSTPMLLEAVARRNEARPDLILEASGGVSLATVRAAAETGVDRISVGALTHSAVQLDFGLDLR